MISVIGLILLKQRNVGGFECVSVFGFKSLLEGLVTHNKNRDREIFESRIRSKGWLAVWPKLRVSAV